MEYEYECYGLEFLKASVTVCNANTNDKKDKVQTMSLGVKLKGGLHWEKLLMGNVLKKSTVHCYNNI